MKSRSSLSFAVGVAVALACGSTPARAQVAGPQRPSIGLFGDNVDDPNAKQVFDLTLSTAGARDSNAAPDPLAAAAGAGLAPSDYSTMFTGTADYVRHRRRMDIRANESSTLRSYGGSAIANSFGNGASHSAGLGFSARASRRTTLLVNQTITSSSAAMYDLFARVFPVAGALGEAPPAAPDYALNNAKTLSYGTSTRIGREVTRRTTLSTTGEWQHSRTVGGTALAHTVSIGGIRGSIAHRVSGSTFTTAEYLYSVSDSSYGGNLLATRLDQHTLDLAFDYTPSLSKTRRMDFGGRLGASNTMVPPIPETANSAAVAARRFTRLTGQLTMVYDLGRTWQTRAIYRRSAVEYVPGVTEPIAADGVTASIDGLFARRLDGLAAAGYSRGKSVLTLPTSLTTSSFDTYTGDLRLRFALTRMFATYVEYLYYAYDSRGGATLALGIPPNVARSGIRAGLMLRLSTLGKVTRAAR